VSSSLPSARLDPARPARPVRGCWWPALLLGVALGALPLAGKAQELPDPTLPGSGLSSDPSPSLPARPARPWRHAGWYCGGGIGLGDATAGGAGKYYSLESLNGGRSVTPWTLEFRGGYTLRPDLRLGLALGAVYSKANQSGLESTAVVGHLGGELSWHPRGDGPFVRGELGLGILQVNGDMALDTSGRDISRTGPALTLGGGYLIGWHQLGIAHLAFSADLSWAHYGGSGGAGGQLGWSLAWTGRVGVDVW
jgi:hypothetical protein